MTGLGSSPCHTAYQKVIFCCRASCFAATDQVAGCMTRVWQQPFSLCLLSDYACEWYDIGVRVQNRQPRHGYGHDSDLNTLIYCCQLLYIFPLNHAPCCTHVGVLSTQCRPHLPYIMTCYLRLSLPAGLSEKVEQARQVYAVRRHHSKSLHVGAACLHAETCCHD